MRAVIPHAGGRPHWNAGHARRSVGRASCASSVRRSYPVLLVPSLIWAGSEIRIGLSPGTCSLRIAQRALTNLILDKSIGLGIRRNATELARPRYTRRLP